MGVSGEEGGAGVEYVALCRRCLSLCHFVTLFLILSLLLWRSSASSLEEVSATKLLLLVKQKGACNATTQGDRRIVHL